MKKYNMENKQFTWDVATIYLSSFPPAIQEIIKKDFPVLKTNEDNSIKKIITKGFPKLKREDPYTGRHNTYSFGEGVLSCTISKAFVRNNKLYGQHLTHTEIVVTPDLRKIQALLNQATLEFKKGSFRSHEVKKLSREDKNLENIEPEITPKKPAPKIDNRIEVEMDKIDLLENIMMLLALDKKGNERNDTNESMMTVDNINRFLQANFKGFGNKIERTPLEVQGIKKTHLKEFIYLLWESVSFKTEELRAFRELLLLNFELFESDKDESLQDTFSRKTKLPSWIKDTIKQYHKSSYSILKKP